MAYIGLVKPTIAKLDESGGTPKYTDGFTCGKAISLDINPQYAEGSLYADDEKAEYDKEFKYADVTLNTSTMPIQAHNVMFGRVVDKDNASGTTVKAKTSDSPNYVGMGIYVKEKVNNVRKFVAMWVPKGRKAIRRRAITLNTRHRPLQGRRLGLQMKPGKRSESLIRRKKRLTGLTQWLGSKKNRIPHQMPEIREHGKQ